MAYLTDTYCDKQWTRRLELLKLAFEKHIFTQDDLVNPLDGRPSIYSEDLKLLGEALKTDRYWLRDTLDVHIEPLGGTGSRGKYVLSRIGSRFTTVFLPAGLVTLTALAQLPQAAPNFPPRLLHELLDDIRARLGAEGEHILDDALTGAAQLAIWRDQNTINPDVLATLRQAVRDRRLVTFDYQPSRDDDDSRRHHVVEPYTVYVQDGHLYLHCYAVQTVGPKGQALANTHHHLRIGRIAADTLGVLDEHYSAERPPPRIAVHYVLSKKLAKDGGSVNFDEIERIPYLNGSLEIRATTERPFEAIRKLLSYGAEVRVLGGDQVRDAYQKAVRRMAEQLQPE